MSKDYSGIDLPEISKEKVKLIKKRRVAEAALSLSIIEWAEEHELDILEIAVILTYIANERTREVQKFYDDPEAYGKGGFHPFED